MEEITTIASIGETLRNVSFKRRDLGRVSTVDEYSDCGLEERPIHLKKNPAKLITIQTFKNLVMNGRIFELVNNRLLDHSAISSADDHSELECAAARKGYNKSTTYRTRRNLSDCTVVVEELWRKALDFAALRRSSISFFDSDRSETAFSRWARALTRAVKVGKGLSKSEKAQKLALTHWLEAIDPQHRYGHNLHLYYNVWFGSPSSQPFFYWLDVGDGKEVNLEECSRIQLQCQRVKYLGMKEREEYEVIVDGDEKLLYKKSRLPVDTIDGSKWIFVLSASRKLYVGKKQKGLFQHSSFLSGGAAICAGRMVAHNGVLEAIWVYSGHYRPSEENFLEFISFLEEQHVDLTNVKKCPIDDDIPPSKISSDEEINIEKRGSIYTENIIASKSDNSIVDHVGANGHIMAVPVTNYTNEENREAVPAVSELGKLPSAGKWTSGVRTCIGCVRGYPAELRFQTLEQDKLSPKVMTGEFTSCCPIPSPGSTPNIHLSPSRLACMGLASPRAISNIFSN